MLPQLSDGTGGTVGLVMQEWAVIYHECATRHSGLVDVYEEQ